MILGCMSNFMREDSIQKYVDARLEHERELRVTQLIEVDRRLEGMNKLREQIEAERGSFISRELFDRLHDFLENRVNVLENFRSNIAGRIWMIGAGLFVLQVIIAIVMVFLRK